MLFNSYAFIFGFLPVVFFGFYRIGRYSHSLASLWLAAASLFFYGWWDPRFVGLLLGSIVFNYGAGYLIGHRSPDKPKLLLSTAIIANLALLGYFKYFNFFIENLNNLVGTTLPIGEFFLPLGISFFTFTQIAFLVDTYQGKVKEYNFVHYTLFVTYFPHLIAGPVLHHKEMMPQFPKRETDTCRINWENVAVGLTIFVLGLVKKVIFADSLAEFATPIFGAVNMGGQPMLVEAWMGALAYTLQLYFDFSAYSDMAIGLSLMFNVRLPMNFNSPYKATSIIEFWRRWHMTLSRFLRDYLYIPLGGSRNGAVRRYFNLMITMLLGGLWHGAGWTFVIWGGLHGFYLMINHAWRGLKQRMGWRDGGIIARFAAGTLTFLAVVVGWVFFRADNFQAAWSMLSGMVGENGVSVSAHQVRYLDMLPEHMRSTVAIGGLTPLSDVKSDRGLITVIIGLILAGIFPNVHQLVQRFRPTLEDMTEPQEQAKLKQELLVRLMEWRPTVAYAWVMGLLFVLSVSFLTRVSDFLYFRF